jgi:hypothetical protein
MTTARRAYSCRSANGPSSESATDQPSLEHSNTGPDQQRRAPSLPDLIITVTAELAGLTELHLGKDFDLIAEITGQEAGPLLDVIERLRAQAAAGFV